MAESDTLILQKNSGGDYSEKTVAPKAYQYLTFNRDKAPAGVSVFSKFIDLNNADITIVSETQFSFPAESSLVAKVLEGSIFTCLSNEGTPTRRYGFIRYATESGGTVTATCFSTTALASGDNSFRIAIDKNIVDFTYLITVPTTLWSDASNPQGMAYRLPANNSGGYIYIGNDIYLKTAASGTGAAAAFNIYAGTSNLHSSAIDLVTDSSKTGNRATTIEIAGNETITARCTSSGGDVKGFFAQIVLYLIPKQLFTGV